MKTKQQKAVLSRHLAKYDIIKGRKNKKEENPMQQPLAYRMRPRTIDEVVGQQHLVGEGKIIRRMVDARMLSSMILYGPPGTGKTSIASAIAGSTNYAFRMLNAATDSKKDLQVVAEEAKMSGTVILLLDEVHRLDKTKQDFLLPHLESGRIILIGATTENPYITINPAIRSRTQIFEVKPLTEQDIQLAVEHALRDKERGLGQQAIQLDEDALLHLSRATNGDLRSALNGWNWLHYRLLQIKKEGFILHCRSLKNVSKEKLLPMTKMEMLIMTLFRLFKNRFVEVMWMLHFIISPV